MPNWTDTTYKITGNVAGVKKIYNALNKMSKRKEPKIKNGFGNMWLGELVNELGGNWEKIRCRGEVTGYEMNEDCTLSIYMMCAWCEQSELRKWLTGTLFVKVYYWDEEPGCSVYHTNDVLGKYFSDRYLLDSYPDEPRYFENITYVADYVSGIIGMDVDEDIDAINAALEVYAKENCKEDEWYALHEFAVHDDSDEMYMEFSTENLKSTIAQCEYYANDEAEEAQKLRYKHEIEEIEKCANEEEQWKLLLDSGIFHDACGKLIDVTDLGFFYTTDY